MQFDGRRSSGPGADRGMVFQSHAPLRWLTVLDNVRFGLRERGLPRAQQLEVAHGFLAEVGLQGFASHYPQAALGRHAAAHGAGACAGRRPAHVLVDEPFGMLGDQTRELVQERLLGIWEERRRTVLFVSHDIDEAVFKGRRVVVMSARPGRVKPDCVVPLAHPRRHSVKTTLAFTELKADAPEQVRLEVRAAQAVQAAMA